MLEHGADIRFIQQMLGYARLDSTPAATRSTSSIPSAPRRAERVMAATRAKRVSALPEGTPTDS